MKYEEFYGEKTRKANYKYTHFDIDRDDKYYWKTNITKKQKQKQNIKEIHVNKKEKNLFPQNISVKI